MFANHPKGLIAASLSNMGERFGFYTMMAILVLFLQAKFGLDGTNAGIIYGVFYALIYILALVGGLIADKTRNYKKTIMIGIMTMAAGYLMIAIPTPTPVPSMALYLTITCIGLFVIAFGMVYSRVIFKHWLVRCMIILHFLKCVIQVSHYFICL